MQTTTRTQTITEYHFIDAQHRLQRIIHEVTNGEHTVTTVITDMNGTTNTMKHLEPNLAEVAVPALVASFAATYEGAAQEPEQDTNQGPALAETVLCVEQDLNSKTYGKVHGPNCGGCTDPEMIEFPGGGIWDLADDLAGICTNLDDAQTDADVLAVLLPCARRVLGIA